MDQHSSRNTLLSEQQALLAALDRLLAPFAQLCIAKGLPIQSVEESLRSAYVKAAREACTDINQNRSGSRISTMTGLTRREVARVQATLAAPTQSLPATRSLATELMTRWASQPEYIDSAGYPLDIARQGPAPSFDALSATITRDIHPRSLLDEMVRLQLLTINTQCDTVSVRKEAFVPLGDWPKMAAFLGENVGSHLHAAVSNVLGTGQEHFEQSLLADELSIESMTQARQLIAQQWRNLLTTLGPELQRLMDADRANGRLQDQSVRVGLYSWSQPMPASNSTTE